MNLIKTKSFELAMIERGNRNSERMTIVIPGRLDTKDYTNNVRHIEYLAERGFFALSFDPPGSWESPGGIDIYTTTNYLKATNELIEYYGNKQTLLLGHSRGGTVAMLAGESNPNVSGVVMIMASYGAPTPPDNEAIERGFQISHRDLPPGDRKTDEQKIFELPINYFRDGEQYDPVTALISILKPKLLICGTRDEFTEPSRVKEVFENIPEPKMLLEVDCEHDYRYHPEVIDKINEKVGQFLDKYFDE